MTETMETKSRKQPMKCWDCDINHMFGDCVQRDEKVRTMHNVHKYVTVE
jgi:hypothetical protein